MAGTVNPKVNILSESVMVCGSFSSPFFPIAVVGYSFLSTVALSLGPIARSALSL